MLPSHADSRRLFGNIVMLQSFFLFISLRIGSKIGCFSDMIERYSDLSHSDAVWNGLGVIYELTIVYGYTPLDSHAAVWRVGGGVSTRHGRRRRRADEVASAAAAAT